jgi:hypothetical protein
MMNPATFTLLLIVLFGGARQSSSKAWKRALGAAGTLLLLAGVAGLLG